MDYYQTVNPAWYRPYGKNRPQKRRYRHGASYARRSAYRSRWGTATRKGHGRTGGYYGRFHTHKTPELKFHDFQLNDAAVAATWTVFPSINLIPQGTTEITRIGRACTIKSIWWKVHMFKALSNSTSNTHDVLRMVMFIDKQCNGAAAGATDLWEVDDFQSFRNLANQHRFTILCDKTISLNSYAGAGNGTANDFASFGKDTQIYKKVSIPLEFNSTAGAITEIRSNNIGIMLISQNGLCGLHSQFRLRFMG